MTRSARLDRPAVWDDYVRDVLDNARAEKWEPVVAAMRKGGDRCRTIGWSAYNYGDDAQNEVASYLTLAGLLRNREANIEAARAYMLDGISDLLKRCRGERYASAVCDSLRAKEPQS